jgi:type II secretory pathway component PulF
VSELTPPPTPPRSGEGGSGARQRIITLLSILPWALLLFQFLLVLPRYDQLFRRFGVKLDDFTTLLLRISNWVRANVLLSFLIVFALMGANVLASVLAQQAKVSRRRRIAMLLVIFGVPCLLFLVTWVGVLATHRRLIEGLQR